MTAICPTCGAECRIVSSSRHPGVDGTNYYEPVYGKEVYEALRDLMAYSFSEVEMRLASQFGDSTERDRELEQELQRVAEARAQARHVLNGIEAS